MLALHLSSDFRVLDLENGWAGAILFRIAGYLAAGSFNARSRQSINRSSLNGFLRKREAAVAPASSAGKALMKMIGLR
jgi:hypothetical protein